MNWTSFQKSVLTEKSFCKVSFRKMFAKNHQLGYCTAGNNQEYQVNIASDAPTTDVRDIVLLHEIGHIYFGHVDLNIKQELEDIKRIFKELKKPYSLIRTYGGPMNFLNICTDLEVNSKLLTIANTNIINTYFKICTPKAYEIPVLDTFRDYYRPLIEKLEENDDEFQDFLNQLSKAIQSDLPESVDPFDNDIDSEIKKELQKENYKDGDSKSEESSEESESDVGDTVEIERVEVTGDEAGSLHVESDMIAIGPDADKQIATFFESLVEDSLKRQQDSMKHYIRGTRRNDSNLLYKAYRRRVNTSNKKLGIIVDVSGSMDSDAIIKMLSCAKSIADKINPQSKVVTCNTDAVESFLITKIPERVRTGGGTRLWTTVNKMIKEGYNSIVIYSDLYLDPEDVNKMTESITKARVDLNTIIVGDYSCTSTQACKDYLKNLKSQAYLKKYFEISRKNIVIGS